MSKYNWVSVINIIYSGAPLISTSSLFHASTWDGPGWTAAQSLLSVLISIQSLMNEKPYHNEPGYERVGTSN